MPNFIDNLANYVIFLDKLKNSLNILNDYYFEVGVFVDNSERKETAKIGVNNAELMFIHEYGSPANNIPKRPVLQYTVEWAQRELLPTRLEKIITKYIESDFNISILETELKKLSQKIQAHAYQLIASNDGTLEANSPETAKHKWEKSRHSKSEIWSYPMGNHPLFDTGQLARSITCRLMKGEVEV